MGEFASKAVAGTALGLAIPGTVALVNQLGGGCGNGGLLGGLFGNGGCQNQTSALMAENAMLKAELNTDAKIAATYKACRDEKDGLGDRLLEKYINPIATEMAAMQVREARNDERIKCMGEKMEIGFHTLRHEFGSAIALEGERRQNGDASIMCYVQGNFVPGKLVMPRSSICPEVMQRYNSWVAPTTPAPDTQAVTGSIQTAEN